MRDMIAGGGLLDLLTLHPLDVLIGVGAAVFVLRLALRGLALHREGRLEGRPHAF